jgi:predicted nucleic acid-binding protein
LINLFAFSDGVGLGISIECFVGPKFRSEPLFVYSDDSLTKRIALSTSDFKSAQIHVHESVLSYPEQIDWVRYAQVLDDGEAQAVAIATHRGLPLLTDDLAGARVGHALGIETVTSLDLAYKWAAERHIEAVRAACWRLRQRARFPVPREGARVAWYRTHLEN